MGDVALCGGMLAIFFGLMGVGIFWEFKSRRKAQPIKAVTDDYTYGEFRRDLLDFDFPLEKILERCAGKVPAKHELKPEPNTEGLSLGGPSFRVGGVVTPFLFRENASEIFRFHSYSPLIFGATTTSAGAPQSTSTAQKGYILFNGTCPPHDFNQLTLRCTRYLILVKDCPSLPLSNLDKG